MTFYAHNDTKVIIRSRNSKNRQYNGQHKNGNRTNNYLQKNLYRQLKIE